MGSCFSSCRRASCKGGAPAVAASLDSNLAAVKSWSNRWTEKRKRESAIALESSPAAAEEGDDAAARRNKEMTEEELSRVPGRLTGNGAISVASLHTQQGKKGVNQDAMVVWENFVFGDTTFCGVFDGHGPHGHLVAKKVRDSIPVKLAAHWKASVIESTSLHQNASMNSEEAASINISEDWGEHADMEEKLPKDFLPLERSFLKAFKSMDKELKLNPSIDCFCSGSTAVTVVKQGQDLVIGNLGDSRAVLGTRDMGDNLIAEQLTVDLKPNLPREAARIQQCRGRVFALQDEPEVARVWLPNNDSPGLAMARAFGDFCLKDYGLISIPEITHRPLTANDEFIILATDGVWDVLSNKEAVDIVASAPTRATAARALVDCAVRYWRLKFPTSKSDDCAAVCLFFNQTFYPKQVTSQPTDDPISGCTCNVNHGHEGGRTGPIPRVDMLREQSNMLHADDDYEIVPVEDTHVQRDPVRGCSNRSLADLISTNEDEEWFALEGVTRANSLLNIPRFLSGSKRFGTRRKWL